jgi:uncharacterized protein (TIGR03118 family)
MKKTQALGVTIAAAGILALAACGGYGGGGGSYGGGSGGGGGGYSSSMSSATAYLATDVVRDTAGAAHTDANLVNGWGVAFNPKGFVWVANNGTNTSTLYDGNGVPQSLVVTLNNGLAGTADPTGIVFNDSTTSFMLNATVGGGAFAGHGGYTGTASGTTPFIFDGEGGTLTAWSPTVDSAHAYVVYDGSAAGAVYKGLAIVTGTTNRLYAADFHNKRIDVFDGTFTKISVAGGFADSAIPSDYAPFNIQEIGGKLYVAYAKKDPAGNDEVAGAGFGYVDVFDTDGNLLKRLVAGGALNAPWGLAMAPANFGQFSNDLLVGNFGDGKINAYDPTTGAKVGTLSKADGSAIVIDGLWGIAFGNGLNNQPANTLFYAAGPSNEAHGAYGRIDPQ